MAEDNGFIAKISEIDKKHSKKYDKIVNLSIGSIFLLTGLGLTKIVTDWKSLGKSETPAIVQYIKMDSMRYRLNKEKDFFVLNSDCYSSEIDDKIQKYENNKLKSLDDAIQTVNADIGEIQKSNPEITKYVERRTKINNFSLLFVPIWIGGLLAAMGSSVYFINKNSKQKEDEIDELRKVYPKAVSA